MPYAFRPLQRADGAALLKIHRQAIFQSDPKIYSVLQMESWATDLTPDGYFHAAQSGETFLIAVNENDQPVGFCGWTSKAIEGLYVHPYHQGMGIATQLLEQAENALSQQNVITSTIDSSMCAMTFYQKQGHALDHTYMAPTRGGIDIEVAILAKELLP